VSKKILVRDIGDALKFFQALHHDRHGVVNAKKVVNYAPVDINRVKLVREQMFDPSTLITIGT